MGRVTNTSNGDIEGDVRLQNAARAIVSVSEAIDADGPPLGMFEDLDIIAGRGYLTPDEDELVRSRYALFLVRRAALLQALEAMEELAGHSGRRWGRAPQAFVLALTAGLVLVRATRGWIELAEACRPVRKLLDQSDSTRGIHRKTFADQYRATTRLHRLGLLRLARDHYLLHREDFGSVGEMPGMREVFEVLEECCGRPLVVLGFGAVLDRWRYRWFSFRRRHHSAWKFGEFTVFRWSGCLIADLRQPGVKPIHAPKRVGEDLRRRAIEAARPGDVFVTRHDDALSNLFLPGFWPHAALYFGEAAREGEEDFLEARKDGVRFREAADTLQVDAFVLLRPPLDTGDIATALNRARAHAGKPYDFCFDFRRSDRLACTEVVYRGFHGVGGLQFELVETSGRHCLPAEELIHQALEQGFKVVAAGGIGSSEWLAGLAAELALHRTRCGL